MTPHIEAFFDDNTNTVSYIVSASGQAECAIIDSVLDYNPKSGSTKTTSADRIIDYVKEQNLSVQWILETHAHADHLTAAPYLQRQLGGQIGIGEHIVQVQRMFSDFFNIAEDVACDGSQFDHLFTDAEEFNIGEMTACVKHTPGHTPACVSYLIGDTVFVGDTLFMPDYGTARADFPGGDASALYRSVQSLLSLPDNTRMFMCHDYLPKNRQEFQWETSVLRQRQENVHVHAGVSESDFVSMRHSRDKTLDAPTLLLPAIQVNIRAGHFPTQEDNGVSYLKIPLNAF